MKLITSYILILSFAVLPIFIGFHIYLVNRTSNLLFYEWISIFPSLKYYLLSYRLNPIIYFSSELIIYSIPTALWAFSFGFLLVYLSFGINYFLLGCIFVSIFEFGQFIEVMSGTFDFMDLFSSLIGYVLPYLFYRGYLWPRPYVFYF